MGRYYSGDINGKFWFGVQSSDDASFFGGICDQPNYLQYEFGQTDTQSINAGIFKCQKKLGKYEKLLDKYFAENNSYRDEKLAESLNISVEKAKELLEWYARLLLGKEISDCVNKNGHCCFDAEL